MKPKKLRNNSALLRKQKEQDNLIDLVETAEEIKEQGYSINKLVEKIKWKTIILTKQ